MTDTTNSTSNKVTLMVTMSSGLKEAIGAYAASVDRSMADVVREMLAEAVGYNLDGEPKSAGRRATKYATPEERKAAQKERERQKRELVRRLLDEHNKMEREQAAEALSQWLDGHNK
jgi:hypothetical protein